MSPRIPGLRRIIRLATGRSRVDADVDDEIAFHLDTTTDALVARGMPREAARREALRRFGDLALTRDRLREIDGALVRGRRRREAFAGLALDTRLAFRGLARSAGFVVAVVLTLTLGLGANATMFGIVDRLLLRPPAHVVEPERTGRMWVVVPNPFGGSKPFHSSWYGFAIFDAMRPRLRAFSHLAAVASTEHTFGRGDQARPGRVNEVTGDYFTLLGARPLLGRFVGPADDRQDAVEAAVVISWELWRRDYGGASTVLGQPLVIDGRPFTIVGVAPRGFMGAGLQRVHAWITMSQAGYAQRMTPDWRTNPDWTWLHIVGRLAPGATRAQANVELTTAYRVARLGPNPSEERQRFVAGSTAIFGDLLEERGPQGTDQARVALWLAGVAGVVLLIACANVANLLLARALRREREVAVQLALGVAGSRLVRQFLLESMLLAVAGGVAALLAAMAGGTAMARLLLPNVEWERGPVDGRVLLATSLVVGVTTLLIVLSPVLQARRTTMHEALRGGGRGATARASRLRTTLTAAQAALSVLLLVGAGLFVRSLHNARGTELGLDAERVLLVNLELTTIGFDREQSHDFWRRAAERVAALPGVERTSLAATAPFAGSWNEELFVPGWDSVPKFGDGGPFHNPVAGDYFRTLGMSLRRGRDFGAGDVAGSAPVTIVNESMARALWPRQDAIGKCFRVGADTAPCMEIVGVVADSRRGELREPASLQYFLPLAQQQPPPRNLFMFVRAAGDDARSIIVPVRRALQGMDARIPFPDIQSIQEHIDPQLRPWKLGATLFTAFGVLALLVAAVGLYGVLAYDVAQRTREIGVRAALGARTRDMVWLVLRRGLGVAAVGIAIGLVAASFAARWVGDLLFHVPARDPITLGAVATLLLAVAAAASFVPAWRASRVNPQVALRAE